MSVLLAEEQATVTFRADELCHVTPRGEEIAYCGYDTSHLEGWCADYGGEAICPSCGYPTCPRCAQLSALADSLEVA